MKKKMTLLLLILPLLLFAAFPGHADPTPLPEPNATILARAQSALGTPYQWGMAGPDAYDAAGLVSYCICGVHTHIGTTYTFMGYPQVTDPLPGDICVNSSNCGIYVGGRMMIHSGGQEGALVCYHPIQHGMIFVRVPGNDIPATGDGTPVLPLALALLASCTAVVLLLRGKARKVRRG